MDKNLTRDQWFELDEQYSKTPENPEAEGLPGEHLKLIAMLNRLGFHPISKQDALKLTGKLLEQGWA